MILASGSQSGGMGSMLILMIVLIGIMYFMMIRPQRKEQKKMEAMLSAMEIGDSVLTTSGFYGVVIDMNEDDVIVEFGNNRNCRIPMKKQAISQVEKPGDVTSASKDDAKK